MPIIEPNLPPMANGPLAEETWMFGGLRLSGMAADVTLEQDGLRSTATASATFGPPCGEQTPLGHAVLRISTTELVPGVHLDLHLGQWEHGGIFIRCTLHNRTLQSVRWQSARLLAADVHFDGGEAIWSVGNESLEAAIPSSNAQARAMWEGFGQAVPLGQLRPDPRAEDPRWRRFRDQIIFASQEGSSSVVAAAVGAEAFVDFDTRIDPLGGHRLEAMVHMCGVQLDPGESRSSDTVLLLAGGYDTIMDQVARWLSVTCGQRTHRPPVVGWCSWYHYGHGVTAADTHAVSLAAAADSDHLALDVMQLDDGYQRQVGDWRCNRDFPHGLAPVHKDFAQVAPMTGIWVAPLMAQQGVGCLELNQGGGLLVDEHPDWLQRDADGAPCWNMSNWGGISHALDPTHPGAQGFMRQIVAELKCQGFTYFKIDFNNISDIARFYDPKSTSLQAFRQLYALYREVLGEDVYVLSCSGMTRGTMGFADASRIGPDSCPLWLAPHPCCITACIKAVGATAWVNGAVYANDPDVSYCAPRGELNQLELRTWHAFVGLLGGLAMVSEPFHEAFMGQEEHRRMLEVLTPPAPEKGRPLQPGTDPWHSRFGFAVRRAWAQWAVINYFNPSDRVADLSLACPLVRDLGQEFHVWEFWEHGYLGRLRADAVVPQVQAHASRMLRLTPVGADGWPQIVGSDLHISCGAAEIAEQSVSPDRIDLVLTDAGARSGQVVIHGPGTLALDSFSGFESVTVHPLGSALWQLQIVGRHRAREQCITLTWS
ncbi:MAG: alpha-galactosidase [Planctomycetota bacterium]|nr:alpha-galactosidase [Planctomycetota bacterium]